MYLILDHHSLLHRLLCPPLVHLYCYCKQPEDGSEMITCDNPVCDIELPHHLFKNHCCSQRQVVLPANCRILPEFKRRKCNKVEKTVFSFLDHFFTYLTAHTLPFNLIRVQLPLISLIYLLTLYNSLSIICLPLICS